MINVDEDALICDLAETYGIFDYESLPVKLVATLAVGLRGDSRIKMKVSGAVLSQRDLILSQIADYTALNVWAKTKDAKHGRNKPTPIRELIANANKKDENDDIVGFDTPEEFERERQRIISEVMTDA